MNSFETGIHIAALGEEPFPGVFIRAPIVQSLLLQAGHVKHASAGDKVAEAPTTSSDAPRLPITILGSLAPDAVPADADADVVDLWEPDDRRAPTQVIGDRPPSDTHIVALRQGKLLVTSFHPELTPDTRLHAYFVDKVILAS